VDLIGSWLRPCQHRHERKEKKKTRERLGCRKVSSSSTDLIGQLPDFYFFFKWGRKETKNRFSK